ncbi:hypothetical protein [Thauera mechernichensis]
MHAEDLHLLNASMMLPAFVHAAALGWAPGVVIPFLVKVAPWLVNGKALREAAPLVAGYSLGFAVMHDRIGYWPMDLVVTLGCVAVFFFYIRACRRG